MDDWVDYSRPQENGNKADVRWLSIGNGRGAGIRVQAMGGSYLSVNPLPWNAGQIRSADYSWQLPTPSATYLNVDHAQMGVGGDNSWGATPHGEYLLKEGRFRYSYRISPLR